MTRVSTTAKIDGGRATRKAPPLSAIFKRKNNHEGTKLSMELHLSGGESKKQKGTAKTTKPRLDAQRYREPLSANEVSFLNASMRLEKSRVLQRSPSSSKTGCDNDDFAGMLPELETLQLQDASVQNSQPVDEVLLKMGSLDLAP